MLKILLAFALGSALTVVVANQGQLVYSVYQEQYPHGTAIKVAPDPANIWSWHGTVPAGTAKLPITIDLDGDGKNDTEDEKQRVLVTDVQVVFPGGISGYLLAWLSDGSMRRWFIGLQGGELLRHETFETPLMLPVGAVLTIETSQFLTTYECHIIGRVITL